MADHVAVRGSLLGNKTYDVLSWIALVFLPAGATFYAGMALLWKWGFIAEVTGTTVLVEAFIGALIGLSKKSYAKAQAVAEAEYNDSDNPDGRYAGDLLIGVTDDERPNTLLSAWNTHPDDLVGQDEVILKVKTVPVAPPPSE